MMNRLRVILLFALTVAGAVLPTHAPAHNPGGGHNTSSTLVCSPNPVVRGNSTTCTFVITDIHNSQNASPLGNVTFTSSTEGAIGACTLGPGANLQSSCSITYTPGAAGAQTVTASYAQQSGAGHTWAATSANTALQVNPAPPAALRVVVAPSGQPVNAVAGVPIQRAGGGGIQVEVLNTLGERITTGTGSNLSITLAIHTNAGGGTLSGTLTVNAVNGVATFANASLNKAGVGYRLRATATGVTMVATNAFDVTAAAASRFAFAQQPVNAVAGQTIGGGLGVTVRVEDAFGNVVASDNTTQVTVAILNNAGGGTLSGTAMRTAVNGVATFNNLSINRTGTGYTLRATGTYTAGDSSAFDIQAGAAARVAFSTPPVTTTAGQVIGGGGGVVARVEDALGNLITDSNAAVTVALAANPGFATLQGTLTVNAIAGVATFPDLVLSTAAIGYTLAATSPGLVGATSGAFNITPSAAVRLAFGQQPTNNEADEVMSPAVTVRIEDASGNLVDDSRLVTIAFGVNAGGAVLGGTLQRAAVNGIATFDDLMVPVAASGYTFVVTTTGGLASAESSPFTIAAGAPTRLEFVQQPTNVAAGDLIAPAVTVRILDTPGNLVASATNAVTLAFGANPGMATLSGMATVNAVNGVATFSTLSVNVAANGYTLAVSATSLAGATSNAFNVAVGTPARVRFVQHPTNTVAGQAIAGFVGGVTARIEDAAGNVVSTSSAAVTLTIDFDAGGIATPLNGTTTVNAAAGVATFPNLSINRVGVGYTLRASSGALATDVSVGFNISHAAAAKLAFGVQPANTTAGNIITPGVTVRVLDQYDNLVTSSTASVGLALGANPGGGVLGGNTTANAVAGVATFNTLFINAAGAGYTLAATSGGLSGAASASFTVNTGAPAKLGFTVQPSHTALLATMTPAVRVAVQDALGNTITGSTAAVSLVLASNPGGGELGGVTTVNAVAGIATFSTLSLDRTGNGYSIQANSSGLASATSSGFNVTVGPPAKLAFVQQPSNTAAATVMAPWPSVQVQDAAGNPVPFAGNITIARGNPNGTCAGTLSGTTTVATAGGVATFDTLQISANGTDCTLIATSGSLASATSNSFNVLNPGFTFTGISPASGPSTGGTFVTLTGSGFGSQIGRYQVIFGTANPAPPVTADRDSNSILTVSTPAHPPGLVNVIVVDTQTGGTRALQGVFTYVSSTPTKLRFGTQPTDIVAGGNFGPPVTVEVLDINNNVVNNATHTITVDFYENIPGGALLGTKSVSAVGGVATFTDLSVDKAGSGYRLIAHAAGLTDPAPSNAFSVSGGAPAELAFGQPPTNNDPGVPMSPAVTVEVHDAYGNLATGSTDVIEMAIGINAGAGTLSGGVSVAASGGIATFTALTIDKAGNGYTLIASAPGLGSIESPTFDIRFGSPSRVAVTTHPGNGTAGVALTPAIVARIEDSLGNLVEDYNGVVTVSFDTNPGGSTLSGTTSVNAVDGVATFPDVILNKVATGYRLAVGAFGLESGITNPFDISNNVAAALQFTVQPEDSSQGSVLVPSPEVRIVDAFGNHVPDATNTITIAIGMNPGGGTLSGTAVRAATGGVALFNDLTISAGGDGYTLTANSPGLTGSTSMMFNVISVGGSLNIFRPETPPGDIVGYLPTIVAGEDFCVDIVKINGAGTGTDNYSNLTITLQMLDASVNTGSLQPGNCRSSWTVIQQWENIPATPGDGSRINVCAGRQGTVGNYVTVPLNEGNVWPNVRFRAFTTSGNQAVGCSNDAFSIRPDFFELTSILITDDDWQTAGTTRDLILPGAPTASGGPVHAAGRPFRVQVTAVNRDGVPTTNYNGKPSIEVLERLLPADCTGCPAPEVTSTGWGQSVSSPGAVRTNQAVFNDAGSLRVRLVDTTFSSVDQVDIDLGLMDPDDAVIVSPPRDIGRFVPDNFVVAPSSTPTLLTQGIDAMTCGPRSFTYLGQAFGYGTLPQATVSARSANGAITPAYRNELWKVVADDVSQQYDDNTVPADAAELDTSMAPLLPGNALLSVNNDGTATLSVNAADRLSYTREPLAVVGGEVEEPPLPFDAFITLTLRVSDESETGVVGNASINTGTPGVFSNIAFDSGNEFRYGRLRLVNTVGSELVPLEIPYRFQTWQDVGNGIRAWVTDEGDNCTVLEAADFSVLNVQNTGVGGLAPVMTGLDETPTLGIGDLTYGAQAPAVTGSFDVFGGGIPSYLQFDWAADGNETGPTAKAAFGVNEGNPRRIFRTQSFSPRN